MKVENYLANNLFWMKLRLTIYFWKIWNLIIAYKTWDCYKLKLKENKLKELKILLSQHFLTSLQFPEDQEFQIYLHQIY